MPRIQAPQPLPLLARLFNRIIRAKFGQVFPSVQLLSHNPRYLLAYILLSGTTSGAPTQLKPQTKALVTQLVAELNACVFCSDLGQHMATQAGLDTDKIQRVLEFQEHPERYTPAEQAALQYAYETTQVAACVSDQTFAELKAHFSDREIMEITTVAAIENFYNRLNAPLEIASQGFCAIHQSTKPS